MTGLVAMVGLAVDGGMAFSDRRAAQNAADAAALAGAMAKINGETYWKTTAWDRAEDNGYYDDIVRSEVDVYSCDEVGSASCGYYQGDPNYIQVIIATNVSTFFARVVGIIETHNRVEAIALAKPGTTGSLFGGNAIVELKPFGTNCSSGGGEFIVGGSGVVNVYGGGVLVNSNNSCMAFQQNGCNTELNLYDGGKINLVPGAGASLQTLCAGQMPPYPDEWGSAEPIEWPPEDYILPAPAQCSQSPASPTYDGINTTTLYPGHYDILPPNGLSGSIVHLAPGNYCVRRVLKAVGASTTLEGTDVFVYIEAGGDFNLNGGNVTLAANTTDDTNPYKGYLLYVAPKAGYEDFSVSPAACTINGGAVSTLTGAILAPYCDITISGSSGSTGIKAQIIGYTITLSGDNILNFFFNADLSPVKTFPPKIGLMK
jgi:hypothetical protein